MQQLPPFDDPNLLIGAEGFSDAGVYALRGDLAIVQSVDFFPPLVDDPRQFGRIAAANALGDLYAMGATPVTALNIVGFPDDELGLEVLTEILRGGAEQAKEAGVVIVGGHSVRDAEIKYGLAVTGTVDPARMMTNRAARPGDVLVLTKALGTGFVTTAHRRDDVDEATLAAAVTSMTTLNRVASVLAVEHGAKAATDITGFGLAGHAREMAEASEVSFEIDLQALPTLAGVERLVAAGHFTRANETNRAYVAGVTDSGAEGDWRHELLYDPQTSGGLLVAIAAAAAEAFVTRCRAEGAPAATVVGRVRERGPVTLSIR